MSSSDIGTFRIEDGVIHLREGCEEPFSLISKPACANSTFKVVRDSFSNHEVRVRAMMMGFGQELPEKPTIADYKTRELRVRLMLEEVLEYAEAAGVGVYVENCRVDFGDLDFQERNIAPDIVKMADAVADCSVVVVGTSVAHGFPLEELQEECDANNLLKLANGHLDEFGKFIKSKDHQKPNFERVLLDAGWDGVS